MTRWQRILSGILVIQLGLTAVVFWPRSQADSLGSPLFPDLKAEDIISFSIEEGTGARIELARQEDGWVVTSGGGYPADSARINPLLEKIAGIQLNRLVAQTKASHARLKVADSKFQSRFILEKADGQTLTFFAGTSPNFRSTHIRRAGIDEVYLINDLNSQDVLASVSSWIDTRYFQLNQDEIVSMTLENSSGAINLVKDESGAWTMAGLGSDEIFNPARVNTILSRLSNFRLSEPLGREEKAEYGLANPQAVLTVVTAGDAGETTNTLLIGAQSAADNSFVVKWSDSEFFVRAAAFNGNDLVQSTRADFIQQPTPTPDAAATPGS